MHFAYEAVDFTQCVGFALLPFAASYAAMAWGYAQYQRGLYERTSRRFAYDV